MGIYCIYRHFSVLISCYKGQGCVAGSRIFVQEKIYDEFLTQFTAIAAGLAAKTGDPFTDGNQHGPQVSKVQFDVRTASFFRWIVALLIYFISA